MVEKFLLDIVQRVRSKKIGIFISGDMMDLNNLKFLPKLRNKIKDMGDLKYATVIYRGKLPEDHFQQLRDAGFSHRIVPSNPELHLIIEVYDTYLHNDVDIIIIASNSEKIIPLLIELRKKSTVYGLMIDKTMRISIQESIDGVINLNGLEDFSFEEKNIPEFSIDGSNIPETGFPNIEMDLANIGTTSDKLEGEVE